MPERDGRTFVPNERRTTTARIGIGRKGSRPCGLIFWRSDWMRRAVKEINCHGHSGFIRGRAATTPA